MRGATDRSLYVHLLGYLRKKELLPVVVFTFSKKRCEENAATLNNTDLCTSSEKSEVHITIEKALSRLKGGARSKLLFCTSIHLYQAQTKIYPKLAECETCSREGSVFIMAACCRSSKRHDTH